MAKGFKVLCALAMMASLIFQLNPAAVQAAAPLNAGASSKNVAVIDSTASMYGGELPTTTSGAAGSFTDYNFFPLAVSSVGAAALGPGGVCGPAGCDTVLLNVSSDGMKCTTASLSAQQKADLVAFVASGHKLIIYDSECTPQQDYSWLPYPFTTSNPGEAGAKGTLNIVEENTLASKASNSPYFIDAVLLGGQQIYSDAVGDMNVMTTYDPNWFLSMSGTNNNNATGPVLTYAMYPPGQDHGLIIYNGMDLDQVGADSVPDTASPGDNLAKIWLQELQQPYNPSKLPGSLPVVGIRLDAPTGNQVIGQPVKLTATLTNQQGSPQAGVAVRFSLTGGPNKGASGACAPNGGCTTDQNGQVSFTYTGSSAGADTVTACFTGANNQLLCSDPATVQWVSGSTLPAMTKLTLTGPTGNQTSGQPVTLKATLTDSQGKPMPGIVITFTVTAGTNQGASGTCSASTDCITDSSGQVSFTYIGNNGAGSDAIEACYSIPSGESLCSVPQAVVEWVAAPVPPAPADMAIKISPLSLQKTVGDRYTVFVMVYDAQTNAPKNGITVEFRVTKGPNAGTGGTCQNNFDCTTDTNGFTSFTYIGGGGNGQDIIQACIKQPVGGKQTCSGNVTVTWTGGAKIQYEYFALGDSIASGHGLWDNPAYPCRQSYTDSYPANIFQQLNTRLNHGIIYPPSHFLACSGATAIPDPSNPDQKIPRKLFHDQVMKLDKMLKAMPAGRTAIVSVGIGVDDYHWLDFANKDEQKNIVYHLYQPVLAYNQWIKSVRGAVITDTNNDLAVMLHKHPNMVLILTNYLNPMNPLSHLDFIPFGCSSPLFPQVNLCYFRTKLLLDDLNSAIKSDEYSPLSQEYQGRVTFFDMSNFFQGHESPSHICGLFPIGIDQSWIQYPGSGYSDSNPLPKLGPTGDCIHPNRTGDTNIATNMVPLILQLIKR